MFNKELENKIKNILDNLKKDNEFEFKFFSDKNNELEYSTYINIIDYMLFLKKIKKYEMKKVISLDVLYNNNNNNNNDNINNVRLSILNIEEINKIYNYNQYKQNNKIFEILIEEITNKNNKNIIGIIKEKYKNQYINIEEYDILVKIANEKKLNNNDIEIINNLKINNIEINYRYKERI